MKRLSLLAQTAVLVAGAWAAAAGLTEAEKIERLLEVVERSEVIFIRNGQEHGPKEAAEHLRSKWQAAGQRIGTAREFVEKLGSSSSLTGEPYRIRQGDGRERLLGEWLLEELRRIEEGPSSGPAPAATAEPAAAPAGPESGPESVLGLIRDSELEFLRVEGDEIEVRSGRQMAGHVRMKHVLAGSPEVGAEDFVRRFCTRSSLHGTDYLVRLPDGRTARLADWLMERLAPGRPEGPSPSPSPGPANESNRGNRP